MDMLHGASILPEDATRRIAALDGVRAAFPLYARPYRLRAESGEGMVLVLAFPGPEQVSAVAARQIGVTSLPQPGQIVLDWKGAGALGISVGESLRFGDQDVVVADIKDLAGVGFTGVAVASQADARRVFAAPESVSYVLAVLEPGADALETVKLTIKTAVPGVEALRSDEFAAETRGEIEAGFLPIVVILMSVSFFVALAVIGITIYTATVELAREFGIMKAIGASPRQLYGIVVRQSLAVGFVGYLLGAGLGFVVGQLMARSVPVFVVLYRWEDFLLYMGAALLISVFASYVPARRVAQIEPAMVFRA